MQKVNFVMEAANKSKLKDHVLKSYPKKFLVHRDLDIYYHK